MTLRRASLAVYGIGRPAARGVVEGLRYIALFLLLRLRPVVRGLAVLLVLTGPGFYALYFSLASVRVRFGAGGMVDLVLAPCATVGGGLVLAYYDRLLRLLSRESLFLPV